MLPPRFPVLDVGVNAVRFNQVLDLLCQWVAERRRVYLSLCNAFTVIAAHDSPAMAEVVNQATLSVPDGMPLVWLGRRQRHVVERVYGPDLMLALCERGEALGLRHYFYGGGEGVNERLAQRLRERFPRLIVAGMHSPPFRELSTDEERRIADDINAARPDVVWVGLGTPKQDFWIARNRPLLEAPVLIPVGAAFDFHSGAKPQAPLWMQRSGLEWLFRLLSEPRRLWKRYLINNPRFVWLIAKQEAGRWLAGRRRADAPGLHKGEIASADICGVRVDSIRLTDLLEHIDDSVRANRRIAVYHANAHLINLASISPALRQALGDAEHVFCDGIGVRIASNILGHPLPERFTPPDWIDDLCSLCERRGYGLFLLGARQGVAEQAAARLRAQWPALRVHTHHGYFDHFGADADRVIEQVNASRSHVLLVGMGMPLQEVWTHAALPRLSVNVALTVGALFDYTAGRVPRGPRWITDHGFEWLWRLVVEPRRLWRRYLIGNPAFLLRVLRQRFGWAAN